MAHPRSAVPQTRSCGAPTPQRPRGPQPGRCLALALSALLWAQAGCVATAVSSPDSTPLREFLARSRAESNSLYRIHPGDQLTARLFFNPQLDQDFIVRPDGSIALKLVGELRAAGKTPSELSAEISRAYAKYFVKPKAVVILRSTAGYRMFTGGELRKPGQVDLVTGAKTVLESLALSGGVTEEGTLSHVYLFRQLPGQPAPMVAELNLKDALSGEDPTQDVELMPDDFVFVPRSSAANLNLAMQQYVFRNLNLRTGTGVGFGFYRGGTRRAASATSGGRLNPATNTGGAATPPPTMAPPTATPMTPTPTPTITPARP